MPTRVEAREAPDYDKKYHAQPSWIVMVRVDGVLRTCKRFSGENPKRDAQAYAKALREAYRKVKA